MTKVNLDRLSVDELVDQFVANSIDQYNAELGGQTRRFRSLYDKRKAIERELSNRPGDQRRALVALYEHPNHEVLLNAAVATLTIEPEKSRQLLRALRDSRLLPQAAEASMTLDALDNGSFKPT